MVALTDNDVSRLKFAGAHYSISNLYTNVHEMLEAEQLDIVSIATRTPVKAEVIAALCESGVRGLYVEKPLANSIEECRRLLDLVAQSDCYITYGVNRRFHNVYRKAKEIINSKKIGNLIEIVIEFDRAPLLWTHTHSMDLLTYFAGEPTHIRAELAGSTFNFDGVRCVDSDPLIESAQIR